MVERVQTKEEYIHVPRILASEVGNLVPMHCGHRGKPSRNEERMLDSLIRESGFLDMSEGSSEELHRSHGREDSTVLRPEIQ
jgi:hypothetical protein